MKKMTGNIKKKETKYYYFMKVICQIFIIRMCRRADFSSLNIGKQCFKAKIIISLALFIHS